MSYGTAWVAGDVLTSSRLNQKTIFINNVAPSPTYAGQIWVDTSNNTVKVRNAANTDWLAIAGRMPIILDDTAVSVAGVTEVEKKYVRFAVTANTPFKNVRVIISLRTNNASGTAYCKIYVDSESTPRKTLNTTQTGETLVEDTFSISNLSTGIHTLRFKFYNSNASYVTTSNIMEVFLEP